ncbi:MAG: hypothetical protein WCB27_09235, partial [Thermoguttaceae bacterium]
APARKNFSPSSPTAGIRLDLPVRQAYAQAAISPYVLGGTLTKNANQNNFGDKATSGAGRAAAPHSAPADAPSPKQERQSPMPGAHRDCGMGKS